MGRNLSPWLMFLQVAEKHRPQYAFEGQTREDWGAWREEALPKVLGTLGPVPARVPLNAEGVVTVEVGTRDECFRLDDAMSCFRKVERIYRAAGCSDRLQLDLFEGGHQWGGNRSAEFFREYL